MINTPTLRFMRKQGCFGRATKPKIPLSLACSIIIFVILTLTTLFCNLAHAYDANHIRPMYHPNCFPLTGYICTDIVNAIGKAENSKRHPYGIMIKTKDPRKTCMNTVNNNVMRYVKAGEPGGDFIHFLSLRYAPIGAANDPRGVNKNWENNVKYFLKKGQ